MNANRVNLVDEVDVLVAGGGTAGAIAAIQSARAGARTLLVEQRSKLGGTMTGGRVSAPAYFYCQTHQIIAGIGWELVRRCHELDGRKMPDFLAPNPRRPSYHVGVDPHVYALVSEEACVESGVKICYNECVSDISEEAERWRIECVGKNLSRVVHAKEIVDCTGDADLVGMLGLARVRGERRQPGTLEFKLGGYELEQLDGALIEQAYRAALADGRLKPGDYCFPDRPFMDFLKSRGVNLQHLFGADSTSSESQAQAELAGHASLLRILRFVRSLPGCAQARIEDMGDYATVRETYRIVGETTVTREDYVSGRKFDDAIAWTLYFIDIHHEEGIKQEFLPKGVVPTIPLGSLIPKGASRILVAGRSLSCDRDAFSALRVEASCMAMGQAAGMAAALGAKRGIPSREVPLDALRTELRKHQALVP